MVATREGEMLLEGLETLRLLASEGTMAKVASRLYISQSAVSKRITQPLWCLNRSCSSKPALSKKCRCCARWSISAGMPVWCVALTRHTG